MRHYAGAAIMGALFAICVAMTLPRTAAAASAADTNRQIDAALSSLYASTPTAVELSKKAKGILVFPDVVKGGFLFGGQFGVGALRVGGRTVGYYSTVAASYGLQIGVQSFGYALFLMDDSSMKFLNNEGGWELGVGPSVVVLDQGTARTLTTATATQGVYAFIFDQEGLMAGMGLQGSKITQYTPDE